MGWITDGCFEPPSSEQWAVYLFLEHFTSFAYDRAEMSVRRMGRGHFSLLVAVTVVGCLTFLIGSWNVGSGIDGIQSEKVAPTGLTPAPTSAIRTPVNSETKSTKSPVKKFQISKDNRSKVRLFGEISSQISSMLRAFAYKNWQIYANSSLRRSKSHVLGIRSNYSSWMLSNFYFFYYIMSLNIRLTWTCSFGFNHFNAVRFDHQNLIF